MCLRIGFSKYPVEETVPYLIKEWKSSHRQVNPCPGPHRHTDSAWLSEECTCRQLRLDAALPAPIYDPGTVGGCLETLRVCSWWCCCCRGRGCRQGQARLQHVLCVDVTRYHLFPDRNMLENQLVVSTLNGQ